MGWEERYWSMCQTSGAVTGQQFNTESEHGGKHIGQCVNLLDQLTGRHIEQWEGRHNIGQSVNPLVQLTGQHFESGDGRKHIG